jgi:hypothetical protein
MPPPPVNGSWTAWLWGLAAAVASAILGYVAGGS